ncbi:pyridoxamine 5'-phosphate oxidase family protein [Streptomyces sp. NPDC058045]|uniref:pyridoxamine 5'-phosphate oxidase family protein n=1 Tax=Streptomyces sp. NPDC058045 TaxID=3346311 RepID=UPI0036E38C61
MPIDERDSGAGPRSETHHDTALALDLLGRTGYGSIATSMRALPCMASARHIVTDDGIVLRLHRGYGYHLACIGSVVAYGADNLGAASAAPVSGAWSVQCVGMCEAASPTESQLLRFGPAPEFLDGERYEAVYLRITPQFATVHAAGGGPIA